MRPRLALSWVAVVTLLVPVIARGQEMTVLREKGDASLEIRDQGKPVLRYQFAIVPVPPGVKGKYAVARGNYIHPLYGPSGEVLTKDYPPDHPHHRGLYWAWPEVSYKGETRDLHALQGVFARPQKIVKVEEGADSARIIAVNKWMWGDTEPIVSEQVTIRALKATDQGRAIDLEFGLTALVDGVTIARRGQDQYGGFNLRFEALAGQKILPHADPPEASPRRAWAQIAGTPPNAKDVISIGIIQHPANPYYPGDWVSFEKLNWLQPTFPAKGVKHELKKDKPLMLRFRLWVGRGVAEDALMAGQWDQLSGARP